VITTDLTVAAIIEKDGRFLMVEEIVNGIIVINQPAGHIEPGESPEQALIREAFEETAWHVKPDQLLGTYLWHLEDGARRFLRIAFTASCESFDPLAPLDEGILRAVWMSVDEICAAADRLRTPMVLRCIEDYLADPFPGRPLQHLEQFSDNIEAFLANAHRV